MGRGRFGRRSDGRDGGGRSRRGGGGGGGGHRRRGSGRRPNPRHDAESGNLRERIAVESGALVLIDQFMLANPQFHQKLEEIVDADVSKKDDLVEEYGGTVIEITPGTYKIERDPFAYTIVVHPEGDSPDIELLPEKVSSRRGLVYIDTRCLAMIDRELLDDLELLKKYQDLWFSGQDKACRDLLRDNGGAVRYGFNREGDELGVFIVQGEDIICLWPEVNEETSEGDGGEFEEEHANA